MALDTNIRGTTGTQAEVTSGFLKVVTETDVSNHANVGAIRFYSENDTGVSTGSATLLSPETDSDYRLRVSNDIILDEEDLTYTAQNFTKHAMNATTFVPTWTAAGFNTNPASGVASLSSTVFRTYKTFSTEGTETLALDLEVSFNYASGVAIPAQQVVEFGFGLVATGATPIDFFDGVYIRGNSSGVYGIIRNNSITDTAATAAFNDYAGAPFVPVSGRKYQFLVYITTRIVQFWVSDPTVDEIWLAGSINTPVGYGQPTASQALQFIARHYISGGATVALNFQLARYNVRRGGTNIATTLNVLAARATESINSAGTLTTTANQTVTTGSIVKSTVGVPTNTAALLTSLSGIVQETATLAAGTDGILMAYQCPSVPTTVGATYAQNKRLTIHGINIASSVTTAFTGGPISKHFYLAYGSTAVSLQGVSTDAVTAKAYRRVQLPWVQAYAATAGAGTVPSGSASASFVLQTPIYVNPGEFVALVTYHVVGTAVSAGAINHSISFDYSWE